MAFSVLKRKCGLQLPLQRLQLRFDQPRFEVRAVERAPLGFAPVGERVREADQEQVRHEQPVELRQVLDTRGEPPARAAARSAASAGCACPASRAEWITE